MSSRVECPRCFNKQPWGCWRCRGTGRISLALCGVDGCIYPTDHEGEHMPMPTEADPERHSGGYKPAECVPVGHYVIGKGGLGWTKGSYRRITQVQERPHSVVLWASTGALQVYDRGEQVLTMTPAEVADAKEALQ